MQRYNPIHYSRSQSTVMIIYIDHSLRSAATPASGHSISVGGAGPRALIDFARHALLAVRHASGHRLREPHLRCSTHSAKRCQCGPWALDREWEGMWALCVSPVGMHEIRVVLLLDDVLEEGRARVGVAAVDEARVPAKQGRCVVWGACEREGGDERGVDDSSNEGERGWRERTA